MRLVAVSTPPDAVISCFKCGHRINLSQANADLDGPAFQAYYCQVHTFVPLAKTLVPPAERTHVCSGCMP